ncbi:hypothetical protein BASA60_005005 [Batrachochytrium salamandrivorans]|nr:hypothetical protein BASA60_005005 [Batrachochytrium salamandrivorans]
MGTRTNHHLIATDSWSIPHIIDDLKRNPAKALPSKLLITDAYGDLRSRPQQGYATILSLGCCRNLLDQHGKWLSHEVALSKNLKAPTEFTSISIPKLPTQRRARFYSTLESRKAASAIRRYSHNNGSQTIIQLVSQRQSLDNTRSTNNFQ